MVLHIRVEFPDATRQYIRFIDLSCEVRKREKVLFKISFFVKLTKYWFCLYWFDGEACLSAFGKRSLYTGFPLYVVICGQLWHSR